MGASVRLARRSAGRIGEWVSAAGGGPLQPYDGRMIRAAEPAQEVVAAPGSGSVGSPPRPIRVLPALLVNQIAAGEVIERPASVVKELIDNAIDAGASRITLEIEAGGIELIRVTDDGCGVGLDQAPLMLAAHATSKIASASDLDRIGTMGFRGEALASIVSVSRVRVRSRTRGEAGAWAIEAEGDSVSPPRPEAGPVGTSVQVRNLFFNTPARRKFLRTPGTEQQHCIDIARDLACAHPSIGFVATCDGRRVFDLPAAPSARERILDVLGRELEGQLLEVSADRFDDSRGALLWGLVGLPAIARATTKAQRVYVNGRPVRDRTIQHALQEAYRGLMPHDRKPTAALLLELAPEAVDVNVHPTKAEVRFRDSGLVHSVVLRAVRDALRAADLTPSFDGAFGSRSGAFEPAAILPGGGAGAWADSSAVPAGGSAPAEPGVRRSLGAAASAFADYFKRIAPSGGARFDYASIRDAVNADQSDAAYLEQTHAAPDPRDATVREREASPHAHSAAGAGTPANDSPALVAAPRPESRMLQVHNSFVVTQDEQGIVIVDQHALHERVMFEAIMERLRVGAPGEAGGVGGALESQRLLTPSVAHAAPAQVELLGQLKPLLARLGVEAEAMGPTSIAVHAFPTLLFERGVEAGEFLSELLERAEAEGLPASEEGAIHEIVDMMACKAAVKAGDRMSGVELAALLDLREGVERSSSCPHGRPTSIRLTVRELEKRFGRG